MAIEASGVHRRLLAHWLLGFVLSSFPYLGLSVDAVSLGTL
jgi:hypothetical protein